jgi:hypothetical protein
MTVSTRIYSRLLLCYPEDLRRTYGEEMVLVFDDELRDADLAGAFRTWRNALTEFVQLALPDCLTRPALRVPLIGIAFSILSLSTEFLLHVISHKPPRFAAAASIPSFAPVLLPFFIIWACRGRAVTSLDIKDR